MPMRLSEPTLPCRLRSRSPERRRYESGCGWHAFPIGIGALLIGSYVVVACVWSPFSPSGIATVNQWDMTSIAEALVGVLGLFAIGSGFIVAGSVLLRTLRVTLDREHDLVIVRSGMVGLVRRQRHLSEFRSVVILHSRNLFAASRLNSFDIALIDSCGKETIIVCVTEGRKFASQFADEISKFTNLPVAGTVENQAASETAVIGRQ